MQSQHEKRNKRNKNRWDKWKTNTHVVDLNQRMQVMTVNINGLNTAKIGPRLKDYQKKFFKLTLEQEGKGKREKH